MSREGRDGPRARAVGAGHSPPLGADAHHPALLHAPSRKQRQGSCMERVCLEGAVKWNPVSPSDDSGSFLWARVGSWASRGLLH